MSTPSGLPLWGQAYTLTIHYLNATTIDSIPITTNSFEPDALRMTFVVQQTRYTAAPWFADICLYNMNDASIQKALLTAVWVNLKAGFQAGPTQQQVIWDGPVMQSWLTRDNVVDTVLHIHSYLNPALPNTPYAFAMGPNTSQDNTLQYMVRMQQQQSWYASMLSKPILNLSSSAQTAVSETRFPRGNTIFGSFPSIVSRIADTHYLGNWFDGIGNANIGNAGDPTNATRPADYIYAPPYANGSQQPTLAANASLSLIGTPAFTNTGCEFSVLLDPRLNVGTQIAPIIVELANVFATQTPITVGQNTTLGAPLNYRYFIQQVTHHGDTRGNDWQTDIIGFSTAYAAGIDNGNNTVSGGPIVNSTTNNNSGSGA